MNQTQALAKLRKALGPKLGYRVDPKAPDADRLREYLAARSAAKAEAEAATTDRNARCEAILAGDAEYQLLTTAAQAASDRLKKLPSAHRYPITVGVDGGGFFIVRAEGDNWDEVVSKILKIKEAA